MSYTALYRKFRPAEFGDVKGQDHIITTLQNQIKANRIGHAYLFCGTRGTGKTTVAKIFAKAVNCEHPVDGSPCGECEMCKSIAAGTSMNVIEIDAASNNGVDNIREIREEVTYRPTEGKYKVYIIDEVHMLSIGAFNALLKTLEEPPEYVIFILATTEVHKIPITILSRCQHYDFKRISIETITERMQELMDTEHVEAEDKALRYIAKAADGSMRDALSLLDQCIAFYLGQKVTYEHVLEVLGAVDTDVFSRLLRKVINTDVPGVLDVVEELVMQGRDLPQLLRKVIFFCLFLGFACLLFFFIASGFISRRIFHTPEAGNYILTLAFICPFLYSNTALISVLNGLDLAGKTFLINLFTLAVRICGVLFLIPQFGILGYLWALLASQLLTFGCCMFLLIKQGR